ncbi:MAG: hypothetical protein Q8T09_08750 [Candidatus Melainabacteria bacterium]|nr:hypothetical protein [Candidatus Melainabacteria bacterium]
MRHQEHEPRRVAPEELAMGGAATTGLPIAYSFGRANVSHQLDRTPRGERTRTNARAPGRVEVEVAAIQDGKYIHKRQWIKVLHAKAMHHWPRPSP